MLPISTGACARILPPWGYRKMQANYKPFVDRMINKYEGGYGWDRADTGGPTKYGITCYDLAEHRGQKMNSMTAWAPLVRDMTLAEAEAIYANKYAKAIRFDDLPSGIDTTMMDYGVNSGTARPIAVARALTGVKGGNTMDLPLMDAIKKKDPQKFIEDMNAERLRFMHAIRQGKSWVTFGKGWQSRVDDLKAYSLRLARGYSGVSTPAMAAVTAAPKATNTLETNHTPTIGGAAGSLISGELFHFPWWGTTALIAAVVVAGVGYEVWAQKKVDDANAKVHV